MQGRSLDVGLSIPEYVLQVADVSHIIGMLRVDIAKEGYVYDFWREIVGMCMGEEIELVNNEDDENGLLLIRIMNEFILVMYKDFILSGNDIRDDDMTIEHIVNTIRSMLFYHYGVHAFSNETVEHMKVIEFITKYLKLLIDVPILHRPDYMNEQLELEYNANRYYLVARTKPQGSENDKPIRAEDYLPYSYVD